MKKLPTESDYEELCQLIRESGKINGFRLKDFGYEGNELCQFVQYRINILKGWLMDYVEFERDLPEDVFAAVHDDNVFVCWRVELYNFEIKALWLDTNYQLSLRWEESFGRSHMPETFIKDPKNRKAGIQRDEGELTELPNNPAGYDEIARQIIEIELGG